jgi:hypothetical protein
MTKRTHSITAVVSRIQHGILERLKAAQVVERVQT